MNRYPSNGNESVVHGIGRWRQDFLWVIACLIAGCERAPHVVELDGAAQGTSYSVRVVAPPAGVDDNRVRSSVEEILHAVDQQMSGYRSDSEISGFNRSRSTDWFPVSPDLAAVVALSVRVGEQSGGTFDVTVAPLVNLWGMGAGGELKRLPTEAQVEQARAQVGFANLDVRIEPPALRKKLPALSVDLNGVAPGYTVDLIAGRFGELGIDNFMIDLGGEVRVRGHNAQGESWRIAVERPVDAEPVPYAVVQLDDMGVTTSGEYRHYVDIDGHRYSHTLDPRTGRPVQHALASVVVVSASAGEADAWATALNVLGEEEGYALARRRGIPAMFIVARDGRLEDRVTPPMQKYIKELPMNK